MTIKIKLGFLPLYRYPWSAWTAKMREESIAALSVLPGVEVAIPGILGDGAMAASDSGTPHGAVQNLDEAEIVAQLFARHQVDALVLCPLDFGDERSASKIAERLRVPVLLYALKEPPVPDRPSMARLSDSYCGSLSIAAGLRRRGLPFHFAGIVAPQDESLRAEVETFTRAVAVVKGLKNARIGQVGVRPAGFESVAYDEVALARKFAINVMYADTSEIVAAAQLIADDDPRVTEIIARLRPGVPTITVGNDYLVNSSKAELALADFWQRSRLSAMASQCWPGIRAALGVSLCAIFGRLTQRQMLTACETDVLGAVSMLASYQAALGDTLPHFVDWTIQHRENPNWLLAWHCGNAPLCLARDPGKIALRSRYDMKGELPAQPGDFQAGMFQFQLKPGRVTFCRLAEMDGQWKMLIAAGDIVPSEETLAGTWAWVAVPDHDRLYRTLMQEGFIHHASMIHGDWTKELALACEFLNVTPIVVT